MKRITAPLEQLDSRLDSGEVSDFNNLYFRPPKLLFALKETVRRVR